LALPEWCLGRERFYIPIISVLQIFQAKTQAFLRYFCRNSAPDSGKIVDFGPWLFIHPVPFTPTTEYWHLVIWRDFVWLFGEVLFGYLARFRALFRWSDDAPYKNISYPCCIY
ncbi:MAG: hypothetical protein PUD78_01305, partial [Bacteroidales bacterium]|nr:hypothetical protein [Bacteroidales bacterium]